MKTFAYAIAAIAVLLSLSGCTKKGESVWDTTPIPTDAPITLTVSPPTTTPPTP